MATDMTPGTTKGMTEGFAHQRWRTLMMTTGIAGLAGTVLILGSEGGLKTGKCCEPSVVAPAADIVDFFASRDQTLYAVGSYLSVVALMLLLWFFGGVWAVLKRLEGEPSWRSTIAFGSGLLSLPMLFPAGWDLAVFRVDEGLDPQLARLAFDMNSMGFAAFWVTIGSFLIAAAWIILESRMLPRWLGWWALVSGAGLVAARAVWTSPFFWLPYLPFWVWVITLSVLLIRRRNWQLQEGKPS